MVTLANSFSERCAFLQASRRGSRIDSNPFSGAQNGVRRVTGHLPRLAVYASGDLEPNARVAVALDSPAIRDRLDDGQAHPPLKSDRGHGSEGILKPEPGSHNLPCTEPAETVTESEIWSSGESPAWRMLLVTSSLTTRR